MYRWWASRKEVSTPPVEHICRLPEDHLDTHVCVCGVIYLTRRQ